MPLWQESATPFVCALRPLLEWSPPTSAFRSGWISNGARRLTAPSVISRLYKVQQSSSRIIPTNYKISLSGSFGQGGGLAIGSIHSICQADGLNCRYMDSRVRSFSDWMANIYFSESG